MGEKITIIVNGRSFKGELNKTETAKALAEILPLEAKPSFWGEEIYFEVPLELRENEEPTEEVEVGDLAYWPDGYAFCIFYGPTPSSDGSEPRSPSPVTVIGSLEEDLSPLREVDSWTTERIRVEKGG